MTSLQLIKKSLKDYYDNLYLLFFLNVIWFSITGPLSYLAYLGLKQGSIIWLLINIFIVGPLTSAVFYVSNRLINDPDADVGLKDLVRGLKLFYWRGVVTYLLVLTVFTILIMDYLFFSKNSAFLWRMVSGCWLYLIIFFAMSQPYLWSLLVELQSAYFIIFKDSLILTLKHPLYSLFIFLVFDILLALGIISFGLFLATVMMGFYSILATNATFNLLKRYGLK